MRVRLGQDSRFDLSLHAETGDEDGNPVKRACVRGAREKPCRPARPKLDRKTIQSDIQT